MKIGDIYYYRRRVPKSVLPYFNQKFARKSLYTDSPTVAEERSILVNQDFEAMWSQLISLGQVASKDDFQQINDRAKLMGFQYRSIDELVSVPLHKLVNRLQTLPKVKNEPEMIEALMGGTEAPLYSTSQALEIFWEISSHEILNKSEEQIRKWRNPIKKAITNFIKIRGDKLLNELNREDITKFRDWWLERIKQDGIATNTVNKELRFIKKVVSSVVQHHNLDVDTDWLFKNYMIKETDAKTRAPFDQEFIRNEILDLSRHESLNDEAKHILFILAELGARPSEIVALEPEDIILNHEIPHIRILAKRGREIKTPYSERELPLVGGALWAFQQSPKGFPRYRETKAGANSLSAVLMKHLKKQSLLPTKDHKLYSLRHSFQDRLTDAGVPDRIQVQLMGHKFNRVQYGQGASLEKKQEWLNKICFGAPK